MQQISQAEESKEFWLLAGVYDDLMHTLVECIEGFKIHYLYAGNCSTIVTGPCSILSADNHLSTKVL